MTKKIHQLSESVINKIAAGEVIENPVSVVKELIDNAIDAKATKITVKIRNGGFLLISVDDNGDGMEEEDLKSCVIRHATSKITEINDLSTLTTMGFRGEALSSICAVSKVTVSSALSNSSGHEMSIKGGKISSIREVARTKGTTIGLTDLFFNTPARKKFQKSAASNTAAIVKLITQFSLSHLNIQFQLFTDEKLILKLNVYPLSVEKMLSNRIRDLFNDSFLETLKWVDQKKDGFRVYGFLSHPKFYRKNRINQYVYINQRYVVSYEISNIVQLAYGTRISENDYPVFILFFELDPKEVDFNVHPQKKQIRLSNIYAIEQLIYECVKSAFERKVPTPKFNLSISPQMDYHFQTPKIVDEKLPEAELPFENSQKVSFEFIKVFERYCFIESASFFQRLKLKENAFIIADLKEIYFLVVYTTLLVDGSSQIEMQSLLVPIMLELSHAQTLAIQDKISFLKASGFDLSFGGTNTIFVHKIPAFFSEENVKDVVEQFCIKDNVDDIKEQKIKKIAQLLTNTKSAFSELEAKLLLKNLLEAKDPFYSPNGKPTLIQCSATDIHKLFGAKKAAICHL